MKSREKIFPGAHVKYFNFLYNVAKIDPELLFVLESTMEPMISEVKNSPLESGSHVRIGKFSSSGVCE